MRKELAMETVDRTVEIDVTGMTCNHCVQHVTEELKTIPAVKNVSVVLDSEAISVVTVVTDVDIADEELKDAIDEAGYEVTEIRRDI